MITTGNFPKALQGGKKKATPKAKKAPTPLFGMFQKKK